MYHVLVIPDGHNLHEGVWLSHAERSTLEATVGFMITELSETCGKVTRYKDGEAIAVHDLRDVHHLAGILGLDCFSKDMQKHLDEEAANDNGS